MLLTDLQIAARNLVNHTRRNAILAAAVATVTALLVVLGGVTAGIRAAMFESATALLTGHVNVGGFFKITSGSGAALVSDFEKVLADARRVVPEIRFAVVRGRGYAKAISETQSVDQVLFGIDVRSEPVFREVVHLSAGRLDDLSQPGTVLLFEEQARQLGVHVGDALTLSAPTTRGVSNTVDVRVVAIASNVGILSSGTAFLPSETLRQLYQLKRSTTGAIMLYLEDPAAARRVAARLRGALASAGWRVMDADPRPYWEKLAGVKSEDWVGQKLDVTTWEDELSWLMWILKALQGLAGLLIGVLTVIVIVGILNTLAIAIRERTQEIGTLRAIGMQRTRVLWLFLLEAALLGTTGTIAGALAGAGISGLLNVAGIPMPEAAQTILMQRYLTLSVSFGTAAGSAAVIAAVTTFAALYPAWYAARLLPVTAMHHVG
ncbi:MAG: ABC transporter permease [Anaeromyxobacter sp. RBG_16_69_14]|nr:MAG: ABC transporter permease [Anaeromyxobacter sp. RBG_16_69_14]